MQIGLLNRLSAYFQKREADLVTHTERLEDQLQKLIQNRDDAASSSFSEIEDFTVRQLSHL